MPHAETKKKLIIPTSAKMRIASAGKQKEEVARPHNDPVPATAPSRRFTLPITPALQMPALHKPALTRNNSILSAHADKSASDTKNSDTRNIGIASLLGAAAKTKAPPSAAGGMPAPKLSFHAMTMALSMTRRVKQNVIKQRHERGLIDFEPTYRMEPKYNQRFKQGKIETIIDDTLKQLLNDKKYEARTASKLACFVSNAVNAKIKEVKMPRYKLVCHVIIGSTAAGDIEAVSRCVWNPQSDNYVSVNYSNGSIYGVATVFGIYLD